MLEFKPYFDILVPGHYSCDIIFTAIPEFPSLGKQIYSRSISIVPGGGALNTTVALKRLGFKVGWIGAFGNDVFSRIVLRWIKAEGIDTSLLKLKKRSIRRLSFVLSYPQERALMTHIDPSPNVAKMLLGVLEQVEFRHLHLPRLLVDDQVPSIIKLCHAKNILVSMDCQHVEETTTSPLVREILSLIDIFMPNALEAQQLTQKDSLEQALIALADLNQNVIVKNGMYGAIARCNGVDYHEPALPLTAIDTTGAGDVFNAGFLMGYLNGKDIQTCLRWANYCGGISTQGVGGADQAPTQDQLKAWLFR